MKITQYRAIYNTTDCGTVNGGITENLEELKTLAAGITARWVRVLSAKVVTIPGNLTLAVYKDGEEAVNTGRLASIEEIEHILGHDL